MFYAHRSTRAASHYQGGSVLSQINKARRLATELTPLQATEADQQLLGTFAPRAQTTTLGDYHAMNDVAGIMIDQGREPYLIDREALKLGMHPFFEMWDTHRKLFSVGFGKGSRDMIMAVTARGDALLPLETLLVWR